MVVPSLLSSAKSRTSRSDSAVEIGGFKPRQYGKRNLRAHALHAGQQPEPVAFARARKADQAQEILPHQQFGMHRHLIADDADGGGTPAPPTVSSRKPATL